MDLLANDGLIDKGFQMMLAPSADEKNAIVISPYAQLKV